MKNIRKQIDDSTRNVICGAPEGVDATILATMARENPDRDILVVLRDAERAQRMADALSFFAPDTSVMAFPAWDCLPYDRASPHPSIAGQRLAVMGDLCERRGNADRPGVVVLATAGSMLQRVPPATAIAPLRRRLAVGDSIDTQVLMRGLTAMGYNRLSTVMEPGDVALRGDILDVFPPGSADPVRIDFFGDEIEQIRIFDALSQRSAGKRDAIVLDPASEILLDDGSVERFRTGWRERFGISASDDPIYEAVVVGVRHAGMEHWLSLFHTHLEPFTAYLDEPLVVLDHRVVEARDSRLDTVRDHFAHREEEARTHASGDTMPYRAIEPDLLYLSELAWDNMLAERVQIGLSPFSEPPSGELKVLEAGGRQGHDFSLERQQSSLDLFDAVVAHIAAQHAANRRVIVSGLSVGSRNRLVRLLGEHGVAQVETVATSEGLDGLPPQAVAATVLGLERGFESFDLVVITEQDILGDRIARSSRKRTRRNTERFLEEASQLSEGDIVVHVEHGIGRFDGLQTLNLGDAPHDCLRLLYGGSDKLFVPVENVELLSRYGSHDTVVQLDRLGSASWQSRRAKLKERITEMAGDLLKIAAERKTQPGPPMRATQGLYQEFCARFPFQETEDQEKAIGEIMDDLGSGRAMDRLVCGDVGFGKTEVALRAAFLAVMEGFQVAVVVPTTLLARQHHTTFTDRFQGLPVEVRQLSRFVTTKESKETKAGLESGKVDIVVGTHALLSKDVSLK
ncbi:MAG: CarD family transcriptional regulator, partial [Alphaproteobacteria bacterium]|nr:CarD family transcriptional regulator [Alphaproteobacteria bacterium]